MSPQFAPEDVEPDAITHTDLESERKRERNAAKIETVLETVAHLDENSDYGDRSLLWFGRRMANLIYHGGMKPSEAKIQAMEDTLRGYTTIEEAAEMLGMTKGGYSSVKSNSTTRVDNSHALHYMTFNGPLNLVFQETLAAESSADYETTWYLLKVLDPDSKAADEGPAAEYGLITETRGLPTPSTDGDKDPKDRLFGAFNNMQVQRFMNSQEVVDHFYENAYFETEERARFWERQLRTHGFDDEIESDPLDRVDPDP